MSIGEGGVRYGHLLCSIKAIVFFFFFFNPIFNARGHCDNLRLHKALARIAAIITMVFGGSPGILVFRTAFPRRILVVCYICGRHLTSVTASSSALWFVLLLRIYP